MSSGFSRVGWATALALALCFVAAGCGSKSSVSGNVTFNGKPVTGGNLVFTPVSSGGSHPGKPASATIKPDGSFTLDTDTRGSGAAVAGKVKVTYTAPVLPYPGEKEGKDAKEGEERPKSGFEGLVPKDQEVELKSGGNTLTIELVPPKAGGK